MAKFLPAESPEWNARCMSRGHLNPAFLKRQGQRRRQHQGREGERGNEEISPLGPQSVEREIERRKEHNLMHSRMGGIHERIGPAVHTGLGCVNPAS